MRLFVTIVYVVLTAAAVSTVGVNAPKRLTSLEHIVDGGGDAEVLLYVFEMYPLIADDVETSHNRTLAVEVRILHVLLDLFQPLVDTRPRIQETEEGSLAKLTTAQSLEEGHVLVEIKGSRGWPVLIGVKRAYLLRYFLFEHANKVAACGVNCCFLRVELSCLRVGNAINSLFLSRRVRFITARHESIQYTVW